MLSFYFSESLQRGKRNSGLQAKEFHFFAYAALGKGLSGGDRIFIELSRRWSKKYPVKIYLWEDGYQICKSQDLTNSAVEFEISSMEPWWRMGFLINYFARIFLGIWKGLVLDIGNNPQTIIYSASEFWMDSLPCFFLKLRFPKIKWVAAWYQTAPSPLKGFSSKNRKEKYRFNALLYWLMQLPIKKLISNFADYAVVNNEDEKKQFQNLSKKNRIIVCLGAVDIKRIEKYQKENKKILKKYDGVFQGRLHPQKGILELAEIWQQVTKNEPSAKLAIIGDGPLMKDLKLKTENLKLKNNIVIFGYLFDGSKKYEIFSQSKVVLHPSYYDSGGMAAAEAMAFGLPGVCFDLPSLKSYYPKGMLKARVENTKDFSSKVLLLLKNKDVYKKLSIEAKQTINKFWSWDRRASQILASINDKKS